MIVRLASTPEDRAAVLARQARVWGAAILRDGEMIALDRCEAALCAGGSVCFLASEAGLEIIGLEASPEGQGAGRALLSWVEQEALRRGLAAVWLSTTNENLRALRLYQRCGFVIDRVLVGRVTQTRALKPSIPMFSPDGIEIRDEIVLIKALA